jgi:hypothetical protein
MPTVKEGASAFLASKRIAVTGVSRKPQRHGGDAVYKRLRERGAGRARSFAFPLGMADWNGQWYLVPMLGEKCNWVQNVHAADERAVLRHRRAIVCRLVEVPVSQ